MFKRILTHFDLGMLGNAGSRDSVGGDDLNEDPELSYSGVSEIWNLPKHQGMDGSTITIHRVSRHLAFHGATIRHPGHKLVVVDSNFPKTTRPDFLGLLVYSL
jgi:hypothetical protein